MEHLEDIVLVYFRAEEDALGESAKGIPDAYQMQKGEQIDVFLD